MRERSVLFLTTVCELTIISIKIATVKTKNFIVVPRPSECSLNPSIQRMVPFLSARLPDAFSPLFQRPYLLFSKTAVSRPRAFAHTTPLPSQSTPHTEPARSRCSINARGTGASPLPSPFSPIPPLLVPTFSAKALSNKAYDERQLTL